MGIGDFFGAGFVNFLSARLENMLANKAQQEAIISAFQAQLETRSCAQGNLFIELYQRAVQHSELDIDYTQPLDSLIVMLEHEGDLQRLFENAIAQSADFYDYKSKLIDKISTYIQSHHYQIPAELGGMPERFVEQLHEFMGMFIELLTPHSALKQHIAALKLQLAKSKLPLMAQPILADTQQPHNFFHKYKYDRRLVHFEKDSTLEQQLDSFCQPKAHKLGADIKIMALYGRAGSGKSRTAFEWCLNLQTQALPWHAGFISNTQTVDNMSLYSWQRPTLIVLDYAANRTEQLQALLNSLQACHQQKLINAPIRILLLERQCSLEHGWLKELLDDANISPYFAYTEQQQPLHVEISAPTLAQNQAIVRSYAKATEQQCDNKLLAHIIDTANRIENTQPRPLILQVISELLLKDTTQNYQSIEQILEALFKNEERILSKAASKANLSQFWALIAIATLAGGTNLSMLKQLESTHPIITRLVTEQNWQLAQLFYGNAANSNDFSLPSLEPDLLGEYGVLRVWRNWQQSRESIFSNNDEPSAQDKLLAQLSLAFTLNANNCADALARTCYDFEKDNLLLNKDFYLDIQKQWKDSNHPNLRGYCDYLGLYFWNRLDNHYKQRDTESYQTALNILCGCHELASASKMTFAVVLFTASSTDNDLNIPWKKQQVYVTKLRTIANQTNNAKVSFLYAMSLVNFIGHCTAYNLRIAMDCITQLTFVAERQNTTRTWVALAKGLVNIVANCTAKDLSTSKHCVIQLSQIANEQNNNEIWRELAKALFNITYSSVEVDLSLTKSYIRQLSVLAKQQDNYEIWLRLAKTLMHSVPHYASTNLPLAKLYIQQLSSIAEQQQSEDIWLLNAKGLVLAIKSFVANNLDEAKILLEQLTELTEQQVQASNYNDICNTLYRGQFLTACYWILLKPNTGGEKLFFTVEEKLTEDKELKPFVKKLRLVIDNRDKP
ncbi:hypothetical protein HG263_16675 [Pseudoalteromonas sp. JBTF-M23]|uniref:Helicase superfamily 3 single-stranded DNA/RNA virus domain-containing protein n=1 Tax=Pseudoalteromonas caenipelagi TaxID=2726988 RepID=A0A849VG29_9GAMM|nr:hypothetical protein [Pseudoalteromonas caenipelagi]NOU52165.1 hypothetical protein [Pseudoalteromonas caenipelagi]